VSWEDDLKAKQSRDKESDDVCTKQSEAAQSLMKEEETFADEKPTITKKMTTPVPCTWQDVTGLDATGNKVALRLWVPHISCQTMSLSG
jgi:hypothetical protein